MPGPSPIDNAHRKLRDFGPRALAAMVGVFVAVFVLGHLTLIPALRDHGLRDAQILGRLGVLEAGLLLIALGIVLVPVALRWRALVLAVADVALADDEAAPDDDPAPGTFDDRTRRRQAEEIGIAILADSDAVSRLADNLYRRAGEVSGALGSVPSEDPHLTGAAVAELRAVTRDARLLSEVVSVTREDFEPADEPFRLRGLIDSATAEAITAARGRGLPVDVLVRDDVPDVLRGDGPTRTRRMGPLRHSCSAPDR